MKPAFIDIIIERDIDRLLLEELSCNSLFQKWFLKQIGVLEQAQDISGNHSVTDNELGESDLVLFMRTASNGVHGVLIENKIDAEFQPRQDIRYRLRGDRGITQGLWDTYTTCLVAPARYLKEIKKDLFDSVLSYEAIEQWFKSQSGKDPRMAFRQRVMQSAIEEGKKGYQKTDVPAVTHFWQEYWSLAQKKHRSLNMPWPDKQGWKSTWIDFYPALLDKGIRLLHKMQHGFVDLQFSKKTTQPDRFPGLVHPLLRNGMSLELRGGSFAVSIAVPKVDIYKDFADQAQSVQEALRAAARLAKWYVKYRNVLRNKD